MGGRAVCRREVEGGSPLSAQLRVVSRAQAQGVNFVAVWKVRRHTSAPRSGTVLLTPSAKLYIYHQEHLNSMSSPLHPPSLHRPCAALSLQPRQAHRGKGRCAEKTVTSPLFSAGRKEGFMAIPTGISAGIFVGLQKLEFTALAIPGQNVEPMRTQVS